MYIKHILGALACLTGLAACGGGDDISSSVSLTTSPTADNIADAHEHCRDIVTDGYLTRERSLVRHYRTVLANLADQNGTTEGDLLDDLYDESYDADEQTLTISGAYQADEDDNLTPIGLLAGLIYECVKDALDMPTRVTEHIGQTRALDGTQTDEWDEYQARWTYHPEDGTQLTIWTQN